MPTLSEFTLQIGLRYEEVEDRMVTFFRFETVRQFRAFSYEIDVVDRLDRERGQIAFIIQGVTAPQQSLAATGPAVKEVVYDDIEGNWEIAIAGAKQQTGFKLRVMPKTLRLIEGPESGFIDVSLVEDVEVVRD